ncbi:MAG: fibronectin type III domain-containing protein, partial [Promethearchaeota archaeon]
DTANFNIDPATGEITNIVPLAVGAYPLTVTATDGNGNSISASITITVEDLPPSKVTGLTATIVSDTQIDLDWDANIEPDLAYYNIYRDGVLIGTSQTNNYSDYTVLAGVTYIYEVSAVDTTGKESEKSDPVSATTGNIIEQILKELLNKLDELKDLINKIHDWRKRFICKLYLERAVYIIEYMIEKVENNKSINLKDMYFLLVYIALIDFIAHQEEISQLCSEIYDLIDDLAEQI